MRMKWKITLPCVLDSSNGASSEYTKFDDCGSYSGVETLCTLLCCNKCWKTSLSNESSSLGGMYKVLLLISLWNCETKKCQMFAAEIVPVCWLLLDHLWRGKITMFYAVLTGFLHVLNRDGAMSLWLFFHRNFNNLGLKLREICKILWEI